MKYLDRYTNEELLTLSEEDVQTLIELQCALDGNPILPPCPVAPIEPEVPLDKVIWMVKYDYSEIAITMVESDAIKIADTINESTLYLSRNEYFGSKSFPVIHSANARKAKIEKQSCASKELVESLASQLEKFKKDSTEYDKALEVYQDALDARKQSVAKIDDAISNASQDEYMHKDALDKYNHYLKLSDGDKKIAMKFFCNNYNDLKMYLPEEILAPNDAVFEPFEPTLEVVDKQDAGR